MVESLKGKSAIETYVLNDLSSTPEIQVPFLSEIWNWQGDTSVLPYKVSLISD